MLRLLCGTVFAAALSTALSSVAVAGPPVPKPPAVAAESAVTPVTHRYRRYRDDYDDYAYQPRRYVYIDRYRAYEPAPVYVVPPPITIYPPPVVTYPPPVVLYPPRGYAAPVEHYIIERPTSCGVYRYWHGDRCVDARYHAPYVGRRY
jgi:hypothetical protein